MLALTYKVFQYLFIFIETDIEHLKDATERRMLMGEMKIQSKNLLGKNKNFASLILLVYLPSLEFN